MNGDINITKVSKVENSAESNKVIRLLWSGLTGKLGREAYKMTQFFPNVKIVAGVTRKNFLRHTQNCSEQTGFPGMEWHDYAELHNVFVDYTNFDVVVDTSRANNFSEILSFAVRKDVPLVDGTSDLDFRDCVALCSASRRIPIFRSIDFAQYISAGTPMSGYEKAAYAILEIASKIANVSIPGNYSDRLDQLLAS